MSTSPSLNELAQQIRKAEATGQWIHPVREQLPGLTIDQAYEIQQMNSDFYVEQGRVPRGRKIGLTSVAVQKQLGVDQPDYGMLFEDMEFRDGDRIPWHRLQQPRIESEIALVLARDLPRRAVTQAELESSVDYAVAAFEITGSRIADWNIRITDTIADNASSGVYVLGNEKRMLDQIDWRLCGMVIEHNHQPVSSGCGGACLGHPMHAALWLANKMSALGTPLKTRDVLLTGALGPMIDVLPGQTYRTRINTLGQLSVSISEAEA